METKKADSLKKAESYERNRLDQLKQKVLEESEKDVQVETQDDNKRLVAVRKVDTYKKTKTSKKGVRNSLATWQNDNFDNFMDTWNDIEDASLKARLYLDSLNFTIGKVRSVDLNLQVKQTTLEDQINQLVTGNIVIEEAEAEVIEEEEEEEED